MRASRGGERSDEGCAQKCEDGFVRGASASFPPSHSAVHEAFAPLRGCQSMLQQRRNVAADCLAGSVFCDERPPRKSGAVARCIITRPIMEKTISTGSKSAWISPCRLAARHSLAQDAHLVEGQFAQHAAAQQAAFVQNLAHPGRRNPRHALDARQQALHDAAISSSGAAPASTGLHTAAIQRSDLLVHHAIEQVVAVLEVVVHHGRRQARPAWQSRQRWWPPCPAAANNSVAAVSSRSRASALVRQAGRPGLRFVLVSVFALILINVLIKSGDHKHCQLPAPAEETEMEVLDSLNMRAAGMPRRPATGT